MAGRPSTAPEKVRKLLKAREQGCSASEAARRAGVPKPTACAILRRFNTTPEEVKSFRDNRAEIFATVQNKAIELQLMIVGSVDKKQVDAMTPSQKAQWADTCARVAGISYDKERLELGQSTQNVASLLEISVGKAMKSNGVDSCAVGAYDSANRVTQSTDKG